MTGPPESASLVAAVRRYNGQDDGLVDDGEIEDEARRDWDGADVDALVDTVAIRLHTRVAARETWRRLATSRARLAAVGWLVEQLGAARRPAFGPADRGAGEGLDVDVDDMEFEAATSTRRPTSSTSPRRRSSLIRYIRVRSEAARTCASAGSPLG